MKTIMRALTLLLFITTATSDANAICEPKDVPGNSNDWIVLQEMPLGCWTDFISKDGEQVHILNLDSSTMLSLDISALNSSVLILTSTSTQAITILISDNPEVRIYVTNGTSVTFIKSYKNEGPVHTQDAPFTREDSELLQWANNSFGGVTSFTTAQNPKTITFTGIKGTRLPSICDLRPEVPTDKPLINLDLFMPPSHIKSCYNKHSGEDLHVINIPDNVMIRRVSVHLLSKTIVVLRGPPNTKWEIHSDHGFQFLSNNPVTVKDYELAPRNELSEDVEGLMHKVFTLLNATSISSYTEIRLNSTAIQLRINTTSTPVVTPPKVVSTTSAPSSSSGPVEMQLFSSPDYRSPLDPSTKVQSDKRLYAEISSKTLGPISFTIRVSRCWARSVPVVRNLPFKEDTSQDCPKRLSFSLELLQDLPSSSWDIECAVRLCHDPICMDETAVKRNVQVVRSFIPSTNPCFEFGLSAVLGVAFGGFLIGVLLTGALWFIKIRTGRFEESTSNKFPLEI